MFEESDNERREKIELQAKRMQAQKAPKYIVDKVLAQLNNKAPDFNVWPINHLIVNLFLLLQTQWDRNPIDNSMRNLNWQSVEIAIKRHPKAKQLNGDEQDELFWNISTMERHAKDEINAIKAAQTTT